MYTVLLDSSTALANSESVGSTRTVSRLTSGIIECRSVLRELHAQADGDRRFEDDDRMKTKAWSEGGRGEEQGIADACTPTTVASSGRWCASDNWSTMLPSVVLPGKDRSGAEVDTCDWVETSIRNTMT